MTWATTLPFIRYWYLYEYESLCSIWLDAKQQSVSHFPNCDASCDFDAGLPGVSELLRAGIRGV